ncbi:MAG: hypothetical protein NTW21_20720 [Verrucomicrobia bacterium]|nr:hypothetical protein [Verrucomicrobiota bacterium]
MIDDFFMMLPFVFFFSFASAARTGVDAVKKTVGAQEKLVAHHRGTCR